MKKFCVKCGSKIKGRTSHIVCESCLLKELKNGKEKENSKEKEINMITNQLEEEKLEDIPEPEIETPEEEKIEGDEPSIE